MGTILKPMTKWINKNKGVLNEEEIMLQVELKLKELLGLNAKEPEENVDAGRELLNILQKLDKRKANLQYHQALHTKITINNHSHQWLMYLFRNIFITKSLFCRSTCCFPILQSAFFNPMSFMPPQFMPHHPAYVSPHNQQPLTLKAFRSPRLTRKSCYLF